ncbi:outer membrane protein assembly factor BamE domain-containing protein [Candidatus Bandiella euplotis]|uniref:Outer membrane protein assembly factor BamE n=1 Tax=Candidatus Bandiella euplotis TaxID=1664265 RepID=A0ABZ0UQT6_9RICK|nr:outer membrane protein assembly factor BamE [Candidatus Bandiella woodruffii]WPX96395.1 Outer membrane protein assembly factor BamE [Candidatus Bandiella woodruffii]
MNNTRDKNKLEKLSEALKNNLKRRKVNAQKTKDNTVSKKATRQLKTALCFFMVLFLVSCVKKLEKTGYLLQKHKLELVKINKTSEQELIHILGEPTTKSSFGTKTYYYMERQSEQMAFFAPKLKEQQVVAIEFNPRNIISNITIYTKDDAKVLSYDGTKENFEGNKIGALEQMVGNFGKFNSQAQKGAK